MNKSRRVCALCVRSLSRHEQQQRRLDVAVVGHPNAGKSTLVNTLCGRPFMPVSAKVHMTRMLMRGYLTEGDTQLVFWDSPGMVAAAVGARHRVPESVLEDARLSFLQCDLLALLVDLTDRVHIRRLSAPIKSYLHRLDDAVAAGEKEVVLVLNKVDAFKGGKRALRKISSDLTTGRFDGDIQRVESMDASAAPNQSTGRGFLGQPSHLQKFASPPATRSGSVIHELRPLDEDEAEEDRDEGDYTGSVQREAEKRGYSGFSAVFPISAMTGYGVDRLRNYLISRAVPGQFQVEAGVRTDLPTESIIENAILSQIYEVLEKHVPYQMNVEVQNVYESTDGSFVVIAVVHSHSQIGAFFKDEQDSLRVVSLRSKELLQSIFQCPVKLSLSVERRPRAKTR